MQVHLAGYNLDTTVIEELKNQAAPREDVTPEVLSAAYARISRDPRPINEIRASAREEVEKTRKSNKTIIFKMGHHSVAEHAVFNFDIIGVSRLAMEELEKFRLCSYTEKSQRYITLDNDYVLPVELKGTSYEERFVEMIKTQNKAYFQLNEKLQDYVFAQHSDLAADPKNRSLLEGWAKEDARYITALATESQVGLTINARNLELMLRRFASSDLAEVKQLGRMIYECVEDIAPSIVVFHEANNRDLKTYPEVKKTCEPYIQRPAAQKSDVELVEYTLDADDRIAAALLHASSDMPYVQCKNIVKELSVDEKKEIFKASYKNMQLFDSMVREFEYSEFLYNVELSSACFGQLKRHRMTTITSQGYDPELGITVPEAVKAIGMEGLFADIAQMSADLYTEIKQKFPRAAAYILTNAHKKRVLVRTNARELYHMSRLREDAHAQWDIRNVLRDMSLSAASAAPLTGMLLCGKDRYNEVYAEVFGRVPDMVSVALPGQREIRKS